MAPLQARYVENIRTTKYDARVNIVASPRASVQLAAELILVWRSSTSRWWKY